eukprot:1219850-Amphidinium_carterae.1
MYVIIYVGTVQEPSKLPTILHKVQVQQAQLKTKPCGEGALQAEEWSVRELTGNTNAETLRMPPTMRQLQSCSYWLGTSLRTQDMPYMPTLEDQADRSMGVLPPYLSFLNF